MNHINSRVVVKDLLSLKEFLRLGLGGTAKTLIPFVVMDDSDEETRFTAVCHVLHTVFFLKTKEQKEIDEAVDMFHGLEIPVIEGSSERI